MNGIVQDLLDFARQRQMTMIRLSVGEVLSSVLKQIRQESEELGVEIVEEADPSLPRAYGNGDKLRQVFFNISRNALQAMSSGGKLTVKTRLVEPDRGKEPREIAISFTDTGPGIPDSDIARVFDPFFTTKDVGTGLGLAICAKIVQDHGGRIEVQSSPGQGATFTVHLPTSAKGDTDRFPPIA
jgi:signal transduction histidine kinase